MTQPRMSERLRKDAAERRRILQIAKAVSATICSDFFNSAVSHLAAAFDADCVYIGELASPPATGIRTLAAFWKGEQSDHLDQSSSTTAAGHVLADGVFTCSKGASLFFPLDPLLDALHADAYAGIRLADSAGQIIGLLVLIRSGPPVNIGVVKAVLETFAPRAAAELERKRSDDLLRQNEERYRAFVSTNPDAMWRIEFEEPIPLDFSEEEQVEWIYKFGYLAECNAAMSRLAGASSPESLTGIRFANLAPREDERLFQELLLAIRSGFRNVTIETKPLDESGEPLYRLRSQFGVVQDGKLLRIWGTTRDITELRRAELASAAAERRFREVLETIQLPALILSPNGAVSFCNDCFRRIAGLADIEIKTKLWLGSMIPDSERDRWRDAFAEPQRGTRNLSRHFEGVILPSDSPPRLIQWNTIPLHGDKHAGLAAIGQDITEQRALEAEIQQTQKLESIGRMAAGVAHDFNGFLTVILGQAGLLLEQIPSSSPFYESLSEIRAAAFESAQLTQKLLTIGRIQDLHPASIALNEVIAGYEGMIRNVVGERIQLHFALDPVSPTILADTAQIHRILTNLVSNARDAMPNGGRLRIATSHLSVGEEGIEHVKGINPGSYAVLSISDTGAGLSEAIRSHLFEPFYTTKEPGRGTGLGLSTVYGIVRQSNGYIRIYTPPDGGTTVDIFFPTTPRHA